MVKRAATRKTGRQLSDDFQAAVKYAGQAPPGAEHCRATGRHFRDPRAGHDLKPDPRTGGWIETWDCLACGTVIHDAINPDFTLASGKRKYEYPDGYLSEPGSGYGLMSRDARRAFRAMRFGMLETAMSATPVDAPLPATPRKRL